MNARQHGLRREQGLARLSLTLLQLNEEDNFHFFGGAKVDPGVCKPGLKLLQTALCFEKLASVHSDGKARPTCSLAWTACVRFNWDRFNYGAGPVCSANNRIKGAERS